MLFLKLINNSKIEISQLNIDFFQIKGFGKGGEWMEHKLNSSKDIEKSTYVIFGFLKYILSLFGFVIAYFIFEFMSIEFVLFSILLFYFVEIHFLFLFPIIIEEKKPILWNCIKSTYKVGLLRAWINVIPIGFYMIVGLLNFRKPLFNWYVGCNSILIWYEKEIRNRI